MMFCLIVSFFALDLNASLEKIPECWICYDPERLDCGPLIQPCKCRGDVSIVHHECLKQWLIEVSIFFCNLMLLIISFLKVVPQNIFSNYL